MFFIKKKIYIYIKRHINNKKDLRRKDFHGDDIVNVRMVQRWFMKFHNGDFNLSDEEGYGKAVEVDNDQISTLIETIYNQRNGREIKDIEI